MVLVVTSSPSYVQRTDIHGKLATALRELVGDGHLGDWHPGHDTLQVAGNGKETGFSHIDCMLKV